MNALRRTSRLLAFRPRRLAWTLAAAVVAFAIAGAALLIVDRLAGWLPASRARGGSMVLYLGEGVSDATARALVDRLGRVAGVERAELVAPADAAKRLERALGADPALLEGVDLASLPGTVEVTLAPGVRDVIAMSPLLAGLRATPGVEDVIVEDGGDPPPATDTLATLRACGDAGAALLVGLAIVVVIAAIRARCATDRGERAVLDLLGAGPMFGLVPAALAGTALGLVASLGAALVVCGAMAPLAIDAPAVGAIALFVAAGAGVGLIGGSLAGLPGATRVAR